jgi:hypothetical protein
VDWSRARLVLVVLVAASACRRAALPPRPDGAAVVLAEPAAGEGEVPSAPEVEPNDTIGKAHRLLVAVGAPAAVNGTVGATEGRRTDVDVFRIELPGPDGGVDASVPPGDAAAAPPPPRATLRAELRPEGALAPRLEVIDAAGKILATAIAPEAGQPVVLPNVAVTSAPPLLRVRRARADGPAGAYRLILRLAPPEGGAEVEPNGSPALANELSANGEAIGYLGWIRDLDFFRIPTAALAEGSVLLIDLDGVPGVAAQLTVTDAAGQRLSEARGNRGERVALRNVGVPAGAPHVFLAASAASGANAEARYAVRVRAELSKPGAEAEPNDDPGRAQVVGDGVVQGYLARADVDVFRYIASGQVTLDVELVPPERASARLDILDGGGRSLGKGEARRRPLKLANLAAEPGPLLIRVAAGKGENNPDEPYRLTIASRPRAAAAGELDPIPE